VTPDPPDQPASTTEDLFPVVYAELKRIAGHHLKVIGGATQLSTTEVVHEAFLKLAPGGRSWAGRAHFFGAASRAMRQVLVDYARRGGAAKRGRGRQQMVSLGQAGAALEVQLDDLLALDQALEELDAVDRRLREVVELRFFGGLSEQETAEMLGLSPRTIERDWLKARLFLLHRLEPH
jgi:RNA polymerase sigma factor (TIGR02999 family)